MLGKAIERIIRSEKSMILLAVTIDPRRTKPRKMHLVDHRRPAAEQVRPAALAVVGPGDQRRVGEQADGAGKDLGEPRRWPCRNASAVSGAPLSLSTIARRTAGLS